MVEGRHNRIKAFQRRHYFTRNRNHYKAGILIECNRHQMMGGYSSTDFEIEPFFSILFDI